jgi:hypothetical protein
MNRTWRGAGLAAGVVVGIATVAGVNTDAGSSGRGAASWLLPGLY